MGRIDGKVAVITGGGSGMGKAMAAAGHAISIACAACHGAGFRGAGAPGPDLRESGVALHLDAFAQVVRQGRMARGMPSFAWLSDDQIRQLHAYVRARAREALGGSSPGTPTGARPPAKDITEETNGPVSY